MVIRKADDSLIAENGTISADLPNAEFGYLYKVRWQIYVGCLDVSLKRLGWGCFYAWCSRVAV